MAPFEKIPYIVRLLRLCLCWGMLTPLLDIDLPSRAW